MLANLAIVGAGGALGACLRYIVVMASLRAFGAGFPWGTLIVNVAGSLVMGAAATLLLRAGEAGAGRFAPLILTGVLGGFTTFSAFSFDALTLIERGRLLGAGLYMGGSVALSVLGVFGGVLLVRGLAP